MLALLRCVALAQRRCAPGTSPAPRESEAITASSRERSEPIRNVDGTTEARTRALANMQRHQAMADAVTTLHRYLTLLGGQDQASADAYWINGRPSARGEEALRELGGAGRGVMRALRIENDAPRPLGQDTVPTALEIPVTLRASLSDGPNRAFHGWYRLRRRIDGKGWEITSAQLDPGRRAE